MRKLTALLAAVIAITGCDKLETTLGYGSVGRYQVVASSLADAGSTVFLVDSKTGTTWRLNEDEFVPIKVVSLELDAARKRNAELKEKVARLEQLKKMKAELLIEKRNKGTQLNPEEEKFLKEHE
jgi:hypothetical protein